MNKEFKTRLKVNNYIEATRKLMGRGVQDVVDEVRGKHVMIVDDTIVPLKEGREARDQFTNLKEKFGQSPILMFVPRKDISYILYAVC